MRNWQNLICCAALLMASAPLASSLEPGQYQTGLLLHATATSAAEGSGGTCHALEVQLADVVYLIHSCAVFPWKAYAPHEFVENGEVELRLEKDKMYLKRPNGKEVKGRIVRKVRVPARLESGYHRYSLQTEPAPEPAHNH